MMNDITLEKIDQVILRVPCASYAQAKEALEKSNGDVIDAIILLESDNNKSKEMNTILEDVNNSEVMKSIKEIFEKGNAIRILVEKNNKTIVNLPITVGVVGIALGPLVTLVGLSAAVIGKCNIKIENESDGKVYDLGELTEEKVNELKTMVSATAKDIAETAKDMADTAKDIVKKDINDDKDITDELLKEEDKKSNDNQM